MTPQQERHVQAVAWHNCADCIAAGRKVLKRIFHLKGAKLKAYAKFARRMALNNERALKRHAS